MWLSSLFVAKPTPSRPSYRDQWVQLALIPLITGFSYYLTYNNIRLNWMMAYELFSDAFKILLVWQVARAVVVWLDGRQPWQRGLLPRLVRQVPLTCLAGTATLTGLVHLEYAFLRDYPMEHYWDFDLVIALIFLLLFNVIYTGLYYYDLYRRHHSLYQRSEAEKQALAEQIQGLQSQKDVIESPGLTPAPEHLVVKLGRRDIVVPYGDIRCCYSAEKETYLLTLDDRQYLLDQSLDRLTEQLPPALFFRANRQFLLSAKAVEQVQPDTHGKLLAQLTAAPRLPQHIVISRDRAPAFRQWLRGAALYDSSPK
ncbi:LytR/AlgR family response regulator transcription factor [Hymenobacter cellulosivorans]|uniref:LytTR family transcriptional regulator n=1 Tax=Hymenobacter cellulosivorans TaxID=2932249 RepID=A0ABY4F3Z5_9BACT|nr:LytTR family DNA-binding domain-containing protein [Hymenobacter cellulosivorans]UOQ51355.1 LytTR family transcriptional regulator [Hymenobacter cellulosivorans]